MIFKAQGDMAEEQPGFEEDISWEYGDLLCQGVAGLITDGERIIYMAGILPVRPNTGYVWALFSKGCGKHMRAIIRETAPFLSASEHGRLEYYVRCDTHSASHKLAKLLGFQCEAERLRKWAPNGDDYALYSRVKS